jgi:hypothetical protein
MFALLANGKRTKENCLGFRLPIPFETAALICIDIDIDKHIYIYIHICICIYLYICFLLNIYIRKTEVCSP